MKTEVYQTLVMVKSDRTYPTEKNGEETVYFSADWSDGKLLSIRISTSPHYPFNDIRLTKESLHAFYELVDELKTLTNNPPVGCESV